MLRCGVTHKSCDNVNSEGAWRKFPKCLMGRGDLGPPDYEEAPITCAEALRDLHKVLGDSYCFKSFKIYSSLLFLKFLKFSICSFNLYHRF